MPGKLYPGDVEVTRHVAVGIDGVNSHSHTVVILVSFRSAINSRLEPTRFESLRKFPGKR